jgi:hypothetical protein
MHLHPKDVGGAIASIDQPVPAASWRWGGPWRRQDGRRGEQRVTAVTVEAARPHETAQRWAEVLGVDAAAGEGAARVGLRRAPSGSCLPVRAERVSRAAPGRSPTSPRCGGRHATEGLAVDDDRLALFGADVTLAEASANAS